MPPVPTAVTGAAGFLGRHVVARLLRSGREVIGIDRRPWHPLPGERAVVADLTAQDEAVARTLATSSEIVHLAGRAGVRDRDADIARARWRDNVLAGQRVLALAPHRAHVVVVSSSSIYGGAGPAHAPRPCHEDDAPMPQGGYARSKLRLERAAAERAAAGGSVGVVRPFTVAGPGQRPDMAFSRWFTALLADEPLRVLGAVQRRRDITDVADVAEGILRMLEGRVRATVNLGTGTPHRLADLAATAAAVAGRPARIEVASVGHEEPSTTCADTARCAQLLGFVPATDLEALLARQLAAHGAAQPDTPRVAPPATATTPVVAGAGSRTD